MKVAILGGTRFIGPFIVRKLVAQGHEVVLSEDEWAANLLKGYRKR